MSGSETNLDVGIGVDLVHGVARSATGFAVQVETLHKHTDVTAAADPDVALAKQLQLDAFADVEPAKRTLLEIYQ